VQLAPRSGVVDLGKEAIAGRQLLLRGVFEVGKLLSAVEFKITCQPQPSLHHNIASQPAINAPCTSAERTAAVMDEQMRHLEHRLAGLPETLRESREAVERA
jgi:hypothetical protein